MISEETMQRVIEKSAAVAYSILGLDNKYSVKLINDPNYVEDGLFGSEQQIKPSEEENTAHNHQCSHRR